MKEQIIKILESYIVDNIGETSPKIDIDAIPTIADEILALQLQQTGVMACFSEEQLSQINKYGKHQHNRGAMDLSYVSFEFWLK